MNIALREMAKLREKIFILRMYLKRYKWRLDKKVCENTVYFIIDPKLRHSGLADRIKVICSLYYIAEKNNFSFKIIFDDPFQLSKFLEPNVVDWRAEWHNLSFSIQNSRILHYSASEFVNIKLNPRIKQYHIYTYEGRSVTRALYNEEESDKIMYSIYQKLFRPSDFLMSSLTKYRLEYPSGSYVAVHFRFVNVLEDFEVRKQKSNVLEDKQTIISKCIDKLNCLKSKRNLPIIVFSDSKLFLDFCQQKGFVILPGKVEHISFSHNDESFLKTFIDFYMMGGGRKLFIGRLARSYMAGPSLYWPQL